MSFKHFTIKDREKLVIFKSQGKSNKEIARLLGKHKSSIGRELKRNKLELSDKEYLPSYANNLSIERRQKAQSIKKEWELDCIEEIKTRLEFFEDPEQISNRMKREGKKAPSHETIYMMIYENRYGLAQYSGCLRRKRKRRQKRGLKNKKRSLIPNRVGIEQRPQIEGFGNWEGDTVIGKNHKGAIATFVDKRSLFFIGQLLEDKSAQQMNKAVKEMFKGNQFLKTFTFDNGLEFSGHEEITKDLGVKCYFANPYHSWERGLNEHTNRLLRQYFPKKTDFTNLTKQDVQLAISSINNRPRKSLNFLTPNEVYFNHSNCHSEIFISNLPLYQMVAFRS